MYDAPCTGGFAFALWSSTCLGPSDPSDPSGLLRVVVRAPLNHGCHVPLVSDVSLMKIVLRCKWCKHLNFMGFASYHDIRHALSSPWLVTRHSANHCAAQSRHWDDPEVFSHRGMDPRAWRRWATVWQLCPWMRTPHKICGLLRLLRLHAATVLLRILHYAKLCQVVSFSFLVWIRSS